MEALPTKEDGMNAKEVIKNVKQLGLPEGKYVVVGGAAMAVRGLRNTSDLDIVVMPEVFQDLIDKGWPLDPAYEEKWNQRRLKRPGVEIHEKIMFLNKDKKELDTMSIIETAEYIESVPFQALESLLLVKKNALREKDALDVELIEKAIGKDS